MPVVVCADLVGAHPSDPRQGLGEQQGEQASDADVAADRVVVQEQLDLGPAVLVGEGDLGLSRLAGGQLDA